jgi:hypothetical protein
MEVEPKDPARPVDWRLRAARQAAESGRYLSPSEFDQLTRDAATFLSRRRRLSKAELIQLARSMPDVSWAIATHQEPAAIRGELEARLLTEESLASIGKDLGATCRAIACYALLCFDVQRRLNKTGFIHQQVIAAAIAAGHHQEAFSKLVAYHGGQKALEYLLGRKRPMAADELVNHLTRRADLFWKFRASQLAADVTTDNRMSSRQILGAVAMVERREAIAGSDSAIQDNIQALLVSMGSYFSAVCLADTPTEGPDSFAAELRTDELAYWTMGLMTPDDVKRLASSKFPGALIEEESHEHHQ